MSRSVFSFLYGTDFHGNIQKYEDIFAYAKKYGIKLIHLGADILPKGGHMQKEQKEFIKGYLKTFYNRCNSIGIAVLASFGNDDIYTRKKYFRESIGDILLDEVPFKRSGLTFKAYNYVPDHPFALKNGCLLDNKNSIPSELYPRMLSTTYEGKIFWLKKYPDPVDYISGGDGRFIIKDIDKYFKDKGTIEDSLKKIRAGGKTIMAIHAPPSQVNLDVCHGFKRVGSDSILHWIEKKQPLLVLSGHIHESHIMGAWKTYIGRTLVIQPGQADRQTTMVHIEIDENCVEADLVMGVKIA